MPNNKYNFWDRIGNILKPHNFGDRIDILKSNIGDKLNFCEIKDTGNINLHGKARVERHLRIGAGAWSHGATAPTSGFDGVFSYLEFDNASDDEVFYILVVPARLDLSIDVEFAIDWYYTGAQDNGTVCWALEYKAIKEGEVVTGAGTVIAKTSAGNHLTGKMVRTTFTTKILASDLEEHDTVGFRFFRDVDGAHDAGDTMLANARGINTHFHFTQNKLGKPLN